VIYAARGVVTMTSEDEPADAIAVQDGRVAAVGMLADLLEHHRDTEVVELAEGVIVPGFHDAHMHLAETAEDLLNVDVSPPGAPSLAALEERLRARAQVTPPGDWIRASRYDDSKTGPSLLTRHDLDEVSTDHPILVVHVASHWGIANSLALAAAGIDESSEAPDGGGYGRDAAGQLNGMVLERSLFEFLYPGERDPVVPPSSQADRLDGLAQATAMFHAAGLTSVVDAFVSPEDVDLLCAGAESGAMSLRVDVLVGHEHYDWVRELAPGAGLAGDQVTLGGVKAFLDGAIAGRTCLVEEPIRGSDSHGIQTLATDELHELVSRVGADGHTLAVHANGDRAIGMLLDAFEAEASRTGRSRRHRIEHCSIVTPELVGRLREIGASAIPFGSYVHYYGRQLEEWYGEERVGRMFAHRWLLDAGVPTAGSSDYPCGPYEPLLGIQSCVTRRGADGELVGPNQRVSAREALALYTTGAAAVTGHAHERGRLAPGYVADFAVLGANPLEVAEDEIASVPLLATYVGGRRVWPV
jgi:predicted amidohydrolase YtcJ